MSREIELLKRIASQDPTALSDFYDAYAGLVMGLATRILRDPQRAEGVVQNVFLTIWKKAHLYDSKQGSVPTWLFTLTRNLAIDQLRQVKRLAETELSEVPDLVSESSPYRDPLLEAMHGERRRLLREALSEIPPEQKLAIHLAYYQGLSHQRIAEKLEQPLGTVKTRIRLGLEKLKERLEPILRK